MIGNKSSAEAEVVQLRAKVEAQARGIAYLEERLAAIRFKAVHPIPEPPRAYVPVSAARIIPDAARQILQGEPRHMPLEELVGRVHGRGLDVKRASVSRSLSRDQRFKSYADGWGFTVSPALSLEGTSTNGSRVELHSSWAVSAPPPTRR